MTGTQISRLRKDEALSPLLQLCRICAPKIDMKKGGPPREGRTARRVTWTCQEGSGSLLGDLVLSFILDRFLR